MSTINSVLRDFLGTFFDHGTHPNAQVGGTNVHESETCHAFEFVNVELEKSAYDEK